MQLNTRVNMVRHLRMNTIFRVENKTKVCGKRCGIVVFVVKNTTKNNTLGLIFVLVNQNVIGSDDLFNFQTQNNKLQYSISFGQCQKVVKINIQLLFTVE